MPGPVGPESVIASLCLCAFTRDEIGATIWSSGSHVIACEPRIVRMQAWVLSAASIKHPPTPPPSPKHPFSMMLSQNLIFVIVFTVHFHVTTWEQSGRLVGGRCPDWKPPKPFGRSAFSYWSPFQTLPSADICTSTDSRTKIFSPKIAAVVLMWARAQDVPMKRKNLSKTLKVAKKSISSHKLFIIIVTSTIHYATENNCKEISQDRMHHHHVWKTAKLNDLSNCLFFILLQAKMRSTM